MKIAVGITFTTSLQEMLIRQGFQFLPPRHSPEAGCVDFILPLKSSSGDLAAFCLREVVEENLYLAKHGDEKLEPHFESWNEMIEPVAQSNGLVHLVATLKPSDLDDPRLHDYLKIRKVYQPWALWLECHDLEKFIKATDPLLQFKHRGKPAALVHLGPNCFDLVVTQI